MPEVPEGSIVITPKEFYDGVSKDIADIKNSVSPLPEMRKDVDDLQHRVSALERRFWYAAGATAVLSAIGTAVATRVVGG